MELILLGIYSYIVWLIFFKFKWLPWNIVSQVIVVTLPIIGLTILILLLNLVAPSSADVRVSALVRNGGAARGDFRADVCVPKPFTPRQIVDAVRTVLARRGARQRIAVPAAHVIAARPSTLSPAALAVSSSLP